ncbi:MAG: DUF2341 domain-containing protein, partial [Elusimicrobia bacterium]|nr:DUF2341 domain-containing protein [Elusimicrobiota bacterium]
MPNSAFASQYWISQNWQKRIPITINNGGSALTDYQVWIATSEFSSAQWSDIKGGTGQSDLDDVRFTKSDKITPLNYWIDSDTNNPTGFWVKVPSVPVGDSTVYIYYGNNNAGTGQSGDDTFIMFDDFESYSTGDLNGQGGWTTETYGNAYAAGTIDITTNSSYVLYGRKSAVSLSSTELLYKNVTVPNSGILVQYCKYISAGNDMQMMIRDSGTQKIGAGIVEDGSATTQPIYLDSADTWAGYGSDLTLGNWYKIEMKFSGSQYDYVKTYNIDGSLFASVSSVASQSYTVLNQIVLADSGDGASIAWNLFYLRKYAATEPTIGSVGTAETVDTVDPVLTQLSAYHKNSGGSWLGSADWNDDASPDVKIQVQDTGAGLRVNQTEIAPSSGCVLMMHFNEGSGTAMYDTSGYGNNGALTASTGSWTTGKFGNAYNFNGFDEYAIVNNTSDKFEIGDHTFSCWAKATGVRNNTKYFLCHYNWNFVWVSDTELKFGVGRMNDAAGPQYGVTVDVSGKKDKWLYLTGIYKPSSQRIYLYIDGKYKGETNIGTDTIWEDYGNYDLRFANSFHGVSTYFDGIIDEVGIWNRALTAEEIAAMYNSSCVKYSTDNGSSWTIEPSTSVVFTSGADGTTSVEISTALAVPLAESGTDNLVRFITSDKAGNVAESASYTIKADTTAPANNGIAWLRADNYNQLTVEGTASDMTSGLHTNGWWFEETSGNPGGSDSTVWESTSVYSDSGLKRNTQYSYRVKMRDKAANESGWCSPVNKKTQPCVWQEKTTTRTGPNAFGFEGDGIWTWKVPANGGSLVTITAY